MPLYEIETDIPIPTLIKNRKNISETDHKILGDYRTHPFATMEVGDTYLYSTNTDRQTMRSASSTCCSFARRTTKNEWKFSCSCTQEGTFITRIK